MNRFSTEADRSHVFDPLGDKERAPKVQEGEWIDLYQLLEISPTASFSQLDEKIIERGADAVYFTFSKTGKPPHIAQLEKHLPQMRPVLLDASVRRRYDEQLSLHQNHDARAMRYEDFLKTLDLREYSGCMTMLALMTLSPALFWIAEKFV